MASTSQSSDALQNELKAKQICRFCLTQQQDKLASIYQRDARLKSTAPLPVQVMACVSIEVFSNDGMPSLICSDCRLLFEHAYRFKQMCKRAEMLLRQFPLTGQWPNPLSKPKFPKELLPSTVVAQMQQPQGKSSSANKEPAQSPPVLPTNKPLKSFDISLPKKLLNADPAESPEPPIPTRFKKEKLDKETTNFLDKVENNEELSMDDVHRLIAATDEDDAQLAGTEQSAVSPQTPKSQTQTTPTTRSKPKLLNKSSIRILNKDAEIVLEPRLSAPQLKRDEDGNMAVVTEILDPQASYEPELDPVKDVTPVETVVFPCPHCERSFPLRQLRDIHMLNHTRNRSFQCSECDKSFFSKYDLQKHNLIHTGDRPFKCTVCDKAFTRATLLHRHEKTHTDIPKFICIYCEKPFISKEQMEKHSERHLKNRPYQCSVCKKSFAFKQGLERHEVIHSREQPYPCQYCEQSFSTPSKLARHLTAHAGKRPYPCKFCPKSYLLSHHLTRHLRSHKYGTVAFMCSDCGKVFKTRDELIYHSAVHATQTLVCPLCKETFQDIQTVTEHIKEHAEGDAFACEFCDLIFMTAERLQQHTDMEHVGDLAAYHEDEAKTQRQLEDTKEADNGAKDNYKSTEGLHILEETIEEFLVDELPDGVNNSNSVVNIKEEHEWTNQTNNQPQVLNQIVYDPKLKSNSGEYFVLSENLTTEANAEFEATEYEDVAVEAQPPAKIRKILNPRPQQVVKSVQQQQPPNQQSTTSIQTRRKIAELSSQKISLNEIKIEKDEETITENCSSNPSHSSTSTINSVLKMLPKSVSVRRNASSIESNVTTENSQARASQLQDTRPASCNSSEGNNIAVTKRGAASGRNSSSREQQSNKKSPSSAATASTDDAISPNQSSILRNIPGASKTVKMMLGHKKVKVQKITLTKAEAAAMTRDGRIRMKDGTLVLTKVAK